MSILARIRANGGDVTRDGHKFTLHPGRMSKAAIEWVKDHGPDLRREIWTDFDEWDERAAIMEYDGGLSRGDAERAAYEVLTC